MDFDVLFDICWVRFACSIDSKDPEGILVSIGQACRHVVEVRTLLWALIGLNPFHCTRLLVLNKVPKDSSFSIMARHLPLQTDRVFGFIISLWGHWRARAHCM